MNTHDLPEKYKKDARGRLVPVEVIKPIDIARDELVSEIIERAKALSETLSEFKTRTMGDMQAFVALSAERYGAKLGGKKGNLSLTSFDGQYRIQLAMQDTLTFDEGLLAAKSLIDECLHEWTEGARAELRALIDGAFDVDKEGKINTARILGLRRLDIKDERWKRAMQALDDSLRIQCSRSYVRVYQRVGDTDEYKQIPLDLSAA